MRRRFDTAPAHGAEIRWHFSRPAAENATSAPSPRAHSSTVACCWSGPGRLGVCVRFRVGGSHVASGRFDVLSSSSLWTLDRPHWPATQPFRHRGLSARGGSFAACIPPRRFRNLFSPPFSCWWTTRFPGEDHCLCSCNGRLLVRIAIAGIAVLPPVARSLRISAFAFWPTCRVFRGWGAGRSTDGWMGFVGVALPALVVGAQAFRTARRVNETRARAAASRLSNVGGREGIGTGAGQPISLRDRSLVSRERGC